ncbi:hypothetical protein Droror1_Dr00018470 [Drosera rotundifolia]
MGKKRKSTANVVKPPELPPEVSDSEIEVSEDDLEFFLKNDRYARFVSRLDTKAINKHVTRVAEIRDDDLEALHEKRLSKRQVEKESGKDVVVDPADALPVKTLDGQLCFRIGQKASSKDGNEEKGDEGDKDNQQDDKEAVVKLTKAERRAKMKKRKKEEKMQAKELSKEAEQHDAHQAEVMAELKKDLTTEEIAIEKKRRIAELGTALLTDPEANIKSLKELLLFCKDEDDTIVKLALLSCSAVFKDIIPGYRIRLPTEKEKNMTVSKDVKRMRFYESTLLLSYKMYLQSLLALEQQSLFSVVTIRCICNLLEAVPHFNFRKSLLRATVNKLGSSDDVVRNLCCSTIKSLLLNEGKHGGEATVEVVRLIADHVRMNDCELHPDSIEVFLSLSFDEDLGRSDKFDEEDKRKKKRQKNYHEQKQTLIYDKKSTRSELLSKAREEVSADIKAATFAQDAAEKRRMQAESLSAVFETYFRVLKHTVFSTAARLGDENFSGGTFGPRPLLASCLKGVGNFSHLIDLDFMADLMKHLKILASSGGSSDVSEIHLTVSERMQCCIVAFKVMRTNLDALKVDLQDFFVQLYNLILQYKPGRDQGEVFSEALKIMLCDDRQHDMQRAAAFVKRLSTSALSFGSAESMAALVTVKNLLQKNVKCRNMLENDPGGGSVSGLNVRYQPCSTDPHLSCALTSVLWELNLLTKHYHPAVSTIASSISGMGTDHTQVYLSTLSPQQAFSDLSLERDSFVVENDAKKFTHKVKRANASLVSERSKQDVASLLDETSLQNKLLGHFNLLRDIKDREKLQHDLDRTMLSLRLYKEYRKEKKKKVRGAKC